MTPKRKTKIKVPVIDIFCQVAKQSLGVEFVKEFQFHKVRKWRFDYALPSHKIALEVEGGAFSYGRHTRASGFIADMEKYNTATCMGWRIVRCTPRQLLTNDTIQMISQLMKICPEAVPQVDNSEIQ